MHMPRKPRINVIMLHPRVSRIADDGFGAPVLEIDTAITNWRIALTRVEADILRMKIEDFLRETDQPSAISQSALLSASSSVPNATEEATAEG